MSDRQQSLIDTFILSIMTYVGTAMTWFAVNLDFISKVATLLVTVGVGIFTIRQSIIATKKIKKEMRDEE